MEQLAGVTKKNIRFYEQEGLLSPKRNLDNGYRDYSEEDLEILKQIKLLRKLAVPIEEIRKIQSAKLTLEDALNRHLISLKGESKKLNDMQVFCQKLIDNKEVLQSVNATQYLHEMEIMEQGGVRFMDLHVNDRKR